MVSNLGLVLNSHPASPLTAKVGPSMKSVVIDARWLSTGIGTYILNLVGQLSRCDDFRLRAVTLPRHQATLKRHCDEVGAVDASMYSIWEQFAIPSAARGCDVLHVPHYNGPLLHQGVLLVSILDVTHILDSTYRNTVKSRVYAATMLRLVSKKAAHIFTLSQYSKNAIVEHLRVPEEKITVTHCGVGPQFTPLRREDAQAIVARECQVDGPYLLYVGNLKPHKNLKGLLHAFKIAKDRRSISHKLLVIGDDARGRSELARLVSDLKLSAEVVCVPGVTGDVLHAAYSGASLTILPSFEEGFGLPIIESMACGTPVACSLTASMPEVGGDAAEYFNPRDVEAMAGAIERVVNSCERWHQLRERGFRQAQRFTWESCARRHVEVYRRFL